MSCHVIVSMFYIFLVVICAASKLNLAAIFFSTAKSKIKIMYVLYGDISCHVIVSDVLCYILSYW